MMLRGRSNLTWTEVYGTFDGVNTAIGLVIAVVAVVALSAARQPGAMTRDWEDRRASLARRVNFPSMTDLVVGWVVAVCTVVGYPVAIYMTFRYATDRRAASAPTPRPPRGRVEPPGRRVPPRRLPRPALIRKEALGTAEEIDGQGVVVMDRLFFRYLASVMRRAWHKSEDEINAAVRAHAARLADPDPPRAWDYRMAMIREAARTWPPEASHELQPRTRAGMGTCARGCAARAKLSEARRVSYARQAGR